MFQSGVGRRTEAASSALTDADVWSKLNADAPTEEFVAAWLVILSSQIPGCRKSLVRVELSEEELAQSTWPQGEAADELVRPIEDAVERRRGVVGLNRTGFAGGSNS